MSNSNTNNTAPELKEDHELDTNDRMYLINKKIDDQLIIDTYENLIEKKKFFKNENLVSVNDYVFNDVEFLHDHYLNTDKGLFNKLNCCRTKMGSLLLKKLFLRPVYDIDLLEKRQEIVLKIKNIKGVIQPILEDIKIIENDLIWFWNDSNLRHIDLMNDLIYFNYDIIPFFNMNETLNNNEKALLVTNIYKIIVSPLLTILTPILSFLVPLIVLFYLQRNSPIKIPIGTLFSQYMKTLIGTDSMKLVFQSPTKAMLASIFTKGIYVFMYLQNIYYSYQSSANTHKIINIIHEKLNKITKYIQHIDKIKAICSSNGLEDLSPFINYYNIQDDLSIYDAYFKFPVFNKDPSLFSNKGKILYTFKKFKENKDKMIHVFHYSGTIDAILSIENILSNSNPENPFCMTKYSRKRIPQMIIKNIWHPYLNKDVVDNIVKNTVDIKNNILITGPNAAGKSTFIKSVILNIILSQTIGLCSASEFHITPFKMIETYLHIPDSKGSSSLFEAEMFRSKEYIEKIKGLDTNDFSFIVLDEIFSSTNYVEGFSGAYSILKKISTFNNTLSITTTHYTDLEVLEKNTNGRIKNYKFEITYDTNNEILFNYVLKEGVSRQYIALDLLKKNGFDDDVLEDAIEMCKSIKEKNLVFNQEVKETVITEEVKETVIAEEVKETIITEEVKETFIAEEVNVIKKQKKNKKKKNI